MGSPSFILSGTDPNGFSGDYPVNFGSPAWQAIVYGSQASLIARAIADGFDGVYLDWVTGYNFAPVLSFDPNPQATMTTFVAAISAYAKAKRPGFAIIAQNAPELAADPRVPSMPCCKKISSTPTPQPKPGTSRKRRRCIEYVGESALSVLSALRPI